MSLKLTRSLKKSHFRRPRSYNPTPPSKNVHRACAGGSAYFDLALGVTGNEARLVEEVCEGELLARSSVSGVDPGLVVNTVRAWKPVCLTRMFSIGVGLETLYSRITPTWVSANKNVYAYLAILHIFAIFLFSTICFKTTGKTKCSIPHHFSQIDNYIIIHRQA